LNEVINQIVTDRPEDPYMILSALLYAKATSKRGIYHVQVREILDGNAIPTILVSLHTGKGIFEGVCSSETSGKLDKVDFLGEEDSTSINLIKRYNGKGYKRRAQKAQEILISKLENIHPTDQQTIDGILMELESEIGRNICMAASIAAVKAGAKYAELMSFAYIAKLCEIPIENACTPLPVFSIINGGKYGANKIFAQEILLTPNGVSSFSEALQLGTEFTWYIKNQLENRGIGFSNSGSFGGFCPQMSTLGEVFQLIKTCMEEFQKKQPSINDNNTSMNSSFRFDLGVDFGANEFVLSDNNSATNSSSKRNGNGIGSGGGNSSSSSSSSSSNRQEEEEEERVSYNYNIDKWVPSSAGQTKTSEEMLDMIRSLIKEFELTTIIDPFDKADIKSFSSLLSAENDLTNASGIISPEDTKKRIYIGNDPNCRIQIVGHKLLEYQGLENIQQERACNTLLIQTSNVS
jgi:enolase